MNIGEKIKKLRTEKLMTQSELAGTEITRNMLSRIENGAALPSLGTIQYIAKRLNVSVGYLMADEKDEQIYFKYNEIDNIKKAYMAGDFKICRDMCYNARSCNDDEVKLVLSECLLELGIEEFNSGRLRNACSYFDEAIESCSATVYNTCFIVAMAGVYFRYMKTLSSTLESSVLDTEKINIYPALSNEFCIYAIYNSDDSCKEIVARTEALNPKGPYAMHISAKENMESNNFSEAYKLLHEILYSLIEVPQPILYHVICDLEICCKELGDYKGAYEYSLEKLSSLQKLLS